jgi:hypothetical protein
MGMDLEWVSSNNTVVNIVATGSSEAQVTALEDVGMAVIAVRSRADPKVETALFGASVAELEPGVQLVMDDQIILPPINPIPNRFDEPYPLGADGGAIIGAFSDQEIAAAYDVEQASNPLGKRLLYPVVLRGQAPPVGAMLVSGESAPLIGRVVAIIAERRGEALVQLELTPRQARLTGLWAR